MAKARFFIPKIAWQKNGGTTSLVEKIKVH